MASGDTAAIDTIDVESALSTKNSEYTTSSSNYNKDQLLLHEQDEYGRLWGLDGFNNSYKWNLVLL